MNIELTAVELAFVAVLSALTALCWLAAATLAAASTAKYHPTWPLAALFGILGLLASGRILGVFGVFKAVPVARAFFLPLLLFGAPLLLWFGRGWLRGRAGLTRRDLLHVVPAAVALAFFVVMYGDQHGLGAEMRSAVGALFGISLSIDRVIRAVYWLFFIQWTVYGAAVLASMSRGAQARRGFFSGIDEAAERRMRYVLMFVLVPWLSLVIQYVVSAFGYPKALEPGASLFRVFCLGAFAVYAIRQTWIFERTPQEQAHPDPLVRYQRSGLDVEALRRIAAKLEAAMSGERLYRNSTLTLRELSDATQVSENHISETLNAFLGQSFFDYVNGWRIKEAETLLVTTDHSVLEILVEVGFNARSTFNAAFRKRTGVTPTAYRKRATAARSQVS